MKPCFNGKYGTATGQTTETAACSDCPAGRACELFATTTNYKTCSAGYYCQTGSITPIPETTAQGGGRCAQGYYCSEGSSSQIACPSGRYCDREGLAEPTGNCEAGYYCTGSNIKQNPRGTNGDVCDNGYYCPEGSGSQIPCPIGTYRDSQGGMALSDCHPCPHGYYCTSTALTTPGQFSCPSGYYCTEGETDSTPDATLCPIGSMCPTGAKIPTKCELGYYQDTTGQTSCKNCPAGSYCGASSTGLDGGISSPIICPIGYYCPINTGVYQLYPCPEGTYGNETGRTSDAGCLACPAGYYCDQKGQTTFTKQLLAGYYSTATGETSPTPSDVSNTKGRCETGHYCPEGSSSLTQCPAGTYNDARATTSAQDCLACPAGYY